MGNKQVLEGIRTEIENRLPWLNGHLRKMLADLVSSVLREPTSNTHVLSEVLPRQIQKTVHRYQVIRRFLSNPRIEIHKIMAPFVLSVVKQLGDKHQTIVIQMDQSQLANGFEVLMVSLRLGERALPIGWKVEKTGGNIGFNSQQDLLNIICASLPKAYQYVLMADRFYGTKMLIQWCQDHDWDYRIRLKGNLLFEHEDAVITPQDLHTMGINGVEMARFHDAPTMTNIGILFEDDHPEPCFIAMNCKPSEYRTRDYGMRWGIESMFSDFKSRGFGLTESHLQHADRFERLILVLALALYWFISLGMYAVHQEVHGRHSKKKETIKIISFYAGNEILSTPIALGH
jgi:hypothetical protein